MKRLTYLLLCLLMPAMAAAENAPVKYTDAASLTIVNKAQPGGPAFQRIDVARYPELTPTVTRYYRYSTGLAVVFRTDSRNIRARWTTVNQLPGANSTLIAQRGLDLYIRRDGKWVFAGVGVPSKSGTQHEAPVVEHMDTTMKECLLYLPLFSELGRIEIGIDEGARIEASANPFRHRIIIFGSSFTHGTSTGRPGMSYPMIMQRNTGLQFISLGVSGNSKLQQSFAQIIGDNACDAIVVDAFSNPGPEMIRERFLPFVAAIRKAHPAVPLIFLQTIYRERANFDLKERAREEEKRRAARTVFEEAAKVYDDIYFVDEPDLTGTDHITSLDGTHPDDLGYWRWANAIQPRIVKILKKYGIR